MTALHVAPCSHKAAKTAVERWHYSQRLPVGRMRRFGVWEDGSFRGALVFSRGANNKLGNSLGLGPGQYCELTRVAMRAHKSEVSRVIRVCLALLKRTEPEMLAVFSFADPAQGHTGGIYKAGNWHYHGRTAGSTEFYLGGRWVHNREATAGAFGSKCRYSKHDRQSAAKRKTPGKHKFVMWLDKHDRRKYAYLCKPYPCASPIEGPTVLGRDEGAEPILALHGGGDVKA